MLFLSFVCLAVRSGAFTDIVQGGAIYPWTPKHSLIQEEGGGLSSKSPLNTLLVAMVNLA